MALSYTKDTDLLQSNSGIKKNFVYLINSDRLIVGQ
jgi:hypothetical protein